MLSAKDFLSTRIKEQHKKKYRQLLTQSYIPNVVFCYLQCVAIGRRDIRATTQTAAQDLRATDPQIASALTIKTVDVLPQRHALAPDHFRQAEMDLVTPCVAIPHGDQRLW